MIRIGFFFFGGGGANIGALIISLGFWWVYYAIKTIIIELPSLVIT